MEISLLNLRNSINKAYLKVKPNRTQIETFKKNITNLFDQIKESESEEFHKNIISEFLKNTYYSPSNYINTKGRSDLVIHNGKDSKSTVGVLFEAKKPSNKSEMPTCENINTKAFHELILYYLRERITNKNIEVKHLVITNIFEWFIFNSNDFEKLFAEDKIIVKQFTDFEEGRLSGTNTDFFYKNIAETFCKKIDTSISVTHFDIRDFETIIKNSNREDDNKLIALYKILSPEHLLKLPFANDSNNLDKAFYNELLHIIGLEETKEGSKKLIGRKIEKKRNPGSLIENSITILKYEDCLSQLPKLSDFGSNKEEQLFNIALELVITWINRILFLKLLEGQLIKYNNGDKTFRFLNLERIHDYDELSKLFFQVLAVKERDRSEVIKQKFGKVPYLNSSLFEPSDLEHKTIRINSLENHSKHPVLTSTVLKDKSGKKLSGEIDPLQYLFEFLDSFDFSSEGSEDIQEENKTLINASVLGLIFEKINGYKDGSFFTPGFITMYMCHETIRRAVVQKFKEVKDWKCETISDVYNKIENINEANQIINSIRICDPAVGSGHFLVSALNEIIAIKSELKILSDREGKKLKEYTIEVINDELIIIDEQSKLFVYNPKSKESQRVQEALFQEKQKIIENCLFGVDINPNSVKICRLRLWIELLKNAYYKQDANYRELETLPNIDINIKCGNSLISRYSLDADIKTALKSSKWNVDNYKEAVMSYRNAQSKEEKRSFEQLINKIKNDFETSVSKSDKRFLKLNKLNGELLSLTRQTSLFELNKTQKEEWNKKVKKLTEEIKKFETEIEQIKSNTIYENAFEWRFEFPEVLNDDGDFIGFDTIIGNPPYSSLSKNNTYKLLQNQFKTYEQTGDIYCLFYELGYYLLRKNGILFYITSNKWMRANYGKSLRQFLYENVNLISLFDFDWYQVFENASVDTNILGLIKSRKSSITLVAKADQKFSIQQLNQYISINGQLMSFPESNYWSISSSLNANLKEMFIEKGKRLKDWNFNVNYGIKTGLNEAFIIDAVTRELLLNRDSKNAEIIKPVLRGRDIERFGYNFSNVWLINSHNGIKEKGINPIDLPNKYPTLFEYLLQFRSQSEVRSDKGDNWFNLRNCAYLGEFEKEKLVWAETMRVHKTGNRNFPRFGYDNSGLYTDKTAFIGLGSHLKYLLGFLNSNIGKWLIKEFVTKLDSGGFMMQKIFIDTIPIYVPDINQETGIEDLVSQILQNKKSNPSVNSIALEAEIDQLFYSFYSLTMEEIQIIEN
jgi:hypothetical protein